MADQSHVRRIALSLPDAEEGDTAFSFGVRRPAATKGIAWVWQERLAPKKPRVAPPKLVRESGL